MLRASIARSRSFDSAEGRFAQDDMSFLDMNFRDMTLIIGEAKDDGWISFQSNLGRAFGPKQRLLHHSDSFYQGEETGIVALAVIDWVHC
jgi:hypothetical protein